MEAPLCLERSNEKIPYEAAFPYHKSSWKRNLNPLPQLREEFMVARINGFQETITGLPTSQVGIQPFYSNCI